ncbi:MAG: porin family protein [Neisseria sp.]|nr:porin family protein [Neisseria sp.]
MSKEELLANPQLLQLALDSALSLDHVENVRFLLPLYRQLPERDPVLLLYAEAVVARADGDLDGAIARYRQIIAERPELTPMRLLLAVALFENHEDTAAADQFEKIRAEKDLPPEVTNVANQYLSALQARQSWSFNAGLQYLQDSNINNAPRERYYGHWKMPEPEAAHGIGYRASLEKTFPLRNGWNTQLGLELDGKSYWDNHRYDEITARAYGGVGYRNLRSQVALLPFFEKKWYGGDSYANMPGFRLQASHWLHPRWQVLGALEYGRKYQQQYKYLDGNSYLGSATAVYLASPRQYWIAGLDLGRETAQDADSTYNRAGVRGGWGQEWGKGVSTLLVAGAAKRRYEDKAWARDEMRRDTEYFATASVWLRDLHWYGLTPRLNVAWQRYSSNHFMYNYQKTKVFIEVSKKF